MPLRQKKLLEWAPRRIQRMKDSQQSKTSAILESVREFTGELIGSFLLITFGIGSVASAILSGAQVGLWQVAVVWGWGVTISIYCSASLSGAHLNPAITLAIALVRRKLFPWWKITYYWVAQLLGGWLAGLCIFLVWGEAIKQFERENMITRGESGSYKSAAMFGEYFPNPGTDLDNRTVTPVGACAIEAFGTGILAFVIFALTDSRNSATRTEAFGAIRPLFIGFTVAVLISLFAPLTQAGWNPARDFGPRLIPAMAGWGTEAIPGPRNGFWTYIIGPLIGAPIGAAIYQYICSYQFRIRHWLEKHIENQDDNENDSEENKIEMNTQGHLDNSGADLIDDVAQKSNIKKTAPKKKKEEDVFHSVFEAVTKGTTEKHRQHRRKPSTATSNSTTSSATSSTTVTSSSAYSSSDSDSDSDS